MGWADAVREAVAILEDPENKSRLQRLRKESMDSPLNPMDDGCPDVLVCMRRNQAQIVARTDSKLFRAGEESIFLFFQTVIPVATSMIAPVVEKHGYAATQEGKSPMVHLSSGVMQSTFFCLSACLLVCLFVCLSVCQAVSVCACV